MPQLTNQNEVFQRAAV